MVSFVVPVYCNATSLSPLYERLDALSRVRSDLTFEFVFVDDGSEDDSYAVLCRLAAADQRVRVVKLTRNFGANPAVAAGLAHARGNCSILLAADLQDPPELASLLIDRWRAGTPVVLAARRMRSDPWLQRLPAIAFNRLFRTFVMPGFPPNGYDYALLDQRVVRLLVRLAEKNAHVFGLVVWTGFPREILYYDRAKRSHGHSMWTLSKKIKYAIDACVSFSYLPLRLAAAVGALLATAGFLYGVVALAYRFRVDIPVPGWTLLVVVVLVTSGVQLLALGVLGEYIWRGIEQTRKRPVYVIESVLEGSRNAGGGASGP